MLRFHSAVQSWPSPIRIKSRPSLQLQVACCIDESPQQPGGRRRWKPRQALHGLWWVRRPRQWRRRVRRRLSLPVPHVPLPMAVMKHGKIHLLFHQSAVAFPPPTLIPRSSHLISRQKYQEVGKWRRRRRRRIIVLGPWRGACLSKLMPDRLSLIYPGLPLLPSQLPAAWEQQRPRRGESGE